MEGYVLSYRDQRAKGGKVVYSVLLTGVGVTLPVTEFGITMGLGDSIVVKVKEPRIGNFNQGSHRRG